MNPIKKFYSLASWTASVTHAYSMTQSTDIKTELSKLKISTPRKEGIALKDPLIDPLKEPVSSNLRDPFEFAVENNKAGLYSQRKDSIERTKETERKAKEEIERYGDKLSFDCSDVQVRTVLQRLGELLGLNLIISAHVKGKITLYLKDIPWQESLDIILKTQSLAKQVQGNIIYIAPFEEIMENSKKIKLWESVSSASIESKLFQIKYANASELANLIQGKETSILSSEGKLIVDTRTNALWIADSPKQFSLIQKVIKQFDIPSPQVLIEARIVNVTKDFAKDLGLRFGITRSNLSGTLKGAEQNRQVPSEIPALSDRLNLDLAATPLTAAPASIGLALAKLGEGILLDLELSALESEGRGEVISSPRLIAINQQAAIIEAGEEIPYQEAVSSGVTAVVFKKAVLSLKVIPKITPDCKILMDLKINQDIASPKVFNGVPTILTKEIQTNALVGDGQTIVLGGIYKQDRNKEVNRVPFLGELPVVGGLFKNQSTSIRNEELLIFITPRIIKQMG